MKNVLLIGCGSKFGLDITKHFLKNDVFVYSVSGSNIAIENKKFKHLVINWKTVTFADIEDFLQNIPTMDFVFFNQNGSSLCIDDFSNLKQGVDLWKQESDWSQTYFSSCILPYHIIQTLGTRCNKKTKIAWMLSSLIYNHTNTKQIGYADYCTNKYQNYLIMKNFSLHHDSCFFGVDPGALSDGANASVLIDNIIKTPASQLNGSIMRINDFIPNDNFDMFENAKWSDNKIKINSINDLSETKNNSSVNKICFVFNVSTINNKSMSMRIKNETFTNLPAGIFKYTTDIKFPSQLNIDVFGKSPNDTVVKDGKIIKDKSIQLQDITFNDVSVDYNYLQQCVKLRTSDNKEINSSYWGFNGTATINFNANNAFLWLVQAKKDLDSIVS